MSRIEVDGLHRLHGEVTIQGSKNSVLPILSACILNEGETILHGCPKIKDVYAMLEALESAGAKTAWEGHTIRIDTSDMRPVPFIEKAGIMRSSVMLLGSFLGRFGKAVIGYPGGCCIGKRPIDLHEHCLSAMGVCFSEKEHYLEAVCTNLEGCELHLPFPSVGVTENLLLAASRASGMTCIYGAAREPEITELCNFLITMGVRISGVGTDQICVMKDQLRKNVEYTICPDRIVAGTYLMAVASAGGEAVLKGMPLQHMRSTIQVVGRLGAQLRRDGNDVKIRMDQKPCPIKYLYTSPYPGFPTDLQSPLLAALCQSSGASQIEERVFENRFLIVEELKKMGANIDVIGQTAYLLPVKALKGADLEAKELRGAAALIIAALGADGVTVIHHADVVCRGYENIAGDFENLGAKICVFP